MSTLAFPNAEGETMTAKDKIRQHPLLNIKASEIAKASKIALRCIRKWRNEPALEVRFKNVSLNEPPKALLLPYLDAEAAGVQISERAYIPRCVELVYAFDNEQSFGQIVVSLDTESEVEFKQADKGQHSSMDRDELRRCGPKILSDPAVMAAVKKLKLPDDAVIQCDTWMYGSDKDSTADTHKFIQGLLYARAPHNHPDSNQYAFPLPISPVFDIFEDRLVRIDELATGGTEDGLAYHTAGESAMEHCVANEYIPEFQERLRSDIKPLQVMQPEGPSFKVEDESRVSWQKWTFRVGFNYREGLTIHNVRYDGRSVFYRLSMSEMTVPYADPRSPYHRKQAFDLGDAGAGSTANNLRLGCDCLGSIKYFSGWLNNDKGEPFESPNVICMHEQDAGIGWKHTNHRTGVAAVTRARTLVLQSILTVGNYEYIFAWIFFQNGTIEFETRATGILSTSLIDPNKQSPWGNVVSPGVLGTNHQHLFCLRIDPMIDGSENAVIQEDTIAIPESVEENPHGNAWKVVRTPFEKSGFADAAPHHNRCFKMVNEAKRNAISGNPVGYKLVPQPSQLLLATATSVVRRRARFAEHHIWVSRYRDGELWAGGRWTNQSLHERDGVYDYAARADSVRAADLVLWHTFGLTHIPRVEDFPVMPCEVITVSLKPADFFDRNPAIDVPPSLQSVNNSVLVTDEKEVGEMKKELEDGCCGAVKPAPKL
ncbi:MAG: hypothetical protein M1818_004737 [Claussenomyces sp. TS43310]|nr:MAG: hypothetical protein M1818_004737 [Claussenomyces sp. TS43310]